MATLLVVLVVTAGLQPAVGASDASPGGDGATPYVIGGRTDVGQTPFMAALLTPGIANRWAAQYCGGALIASRWVLTAASCVVGSPVPRVLLGTANLNSGGTVYDVRRVVTHPSYRGGTNGYDIALLELSSSPPGPPMGWMTPGLEPYLPAADGLLLGWGATNTSGTSFPTDLRLANIDIVEPHVCASIPGVESWNIVCGGNPSGAGCNLDYGGPLIVECIDRHLLVAGVLSGVRTPCGSGPDVYTRVSVHDGWIRSVVGGSTTTATAAERQRDSIVRLYRAYFLRAPDGGGLAYWVSAYQRGYTLSWVSQHFADSAEFRSRYGALDDRAFVELVYYNVLGRAPDVGGQLYWESMLRAGRTRGWVMIGFSESSEFVRITGTLPPR